MSEAIVVNRKIKVIMFTDIVGFTSIMSFDESCGISVLNTKNKYLQNILNSHNGTLIKKMGDGSLSIFDSSIDAVRCGQELLKFIDSECDFKIRIGIHLGEVVYKNDDVFGEGVNIASRLESIARPDSIIISKDIYNQLGNHQEFSPVSIGVHSIKGIGRVIELFLIGNHRNEGTYLTEKINKVPSNTDTDLISIGIMLFKNLGQEEDSYYSYGITHDLISELSHSQKFIIKYLDHYNDVSIDNDVYQALQKKYNIDYVIGGSMWKRDGLFQLDINLFDISSNSILWSDHWYENWENLPILMDKISDGVSSVFSAKSTTRAKLCKTIPAITEAFRIYLEAKHLYHHRTSGADLLKVESLLRKATEMDDKLINAYMLLGELFSDEGEYASALKVYKTSLEHCREFDDHNKLAACLNDIGDVLFEMGRLDEALSYQQESLSICENVNNIRGIGYVLNSIGNIYSTQSDLENAEKYLLNSLEIREMLENDMNIAITLGNLSLVKISAEDYEAAVPLAEKSLFLREKIEDRHGVGNAKNILGNIYLKMDDPDNAATYINESIKEKIAINDRHGLMISFISLGNLYVYKKDLEVALSHYKNALDIGCEINNWPGICSTLENMANIYQETGNNKIALDVMEKSLLIRKKIGCKRPIKETQERIEQISGESQLTTLKSSIRYINYPQYKQQFRLPFVNINESGFVEKINIDKIPDNIAHLNQIINDFPDYQV